MLDRKKENNTVCSSINLPSNLVNNVFASVHYLDFNIKLLFFSPKILGLSLAGGENLRRSDFDDLKNFQS